MQDKIRTLIVDDEAYNREELIFLLNQHASIEIVGEAESGEACIVEATKTQPDLVFLDIEMPGMGGMEAADLLLELKKRPIIVFATAYPQFAVQAFRLEALDYLLKPYDEEQLNETISRVEKKLFPGSRQNKQPIVAEKLAVHIDDEVFYLDPVDILYIYSQEKQVKIVTKNKTYAVNGTLKDFEARLSSFLFFRIHKSYLVNLNYVNKLTPWFSGTYNLSMNGVEESLPVSRNYVKDLRERLEI